MDAPDTRTRMVQLANSFPSVGRGLFGPIKTWDDETMSTLCAHYPRASSGEAQALSFLFHVWNRFAARACDHVEPFDIFVALDVWDRSHYEAFKAWVEKPWTA